MLIAHESFTTDLPDLLDRRPERLVVIGFRCWMVGYEYRDIDCWETAWNLYSGELDSAAARDAITGLQHWVRSVRVATTRTLKWFPHCCKYVCKDECMALSLVSAVQHGDNKTAWAAAHHLTGATSSEAVDMAADAAIPFACSLLEAALRLGSVTPQVVDLIATHGNKPVHGFSALQ